MLSGKKTILLLDEFAWKLLYDFVASFVTTQHLVENYLYYRANSFRYLVSWRVKAVKYLDQ